MNEMICKVDECDGIVNYEKPLTISPGKTTRTFYPCKKCSRAHWYSGNPVFGRDDVELYINKGAIEFRKGGEVMARYP
jgi:hypothetical protein